MKRTLTSRERLKLTLKHIQPDRPPVMFHHTPEILDALSKYFLGKFGDADVNKALEVDFVNVSPVRIKPSARMLAGQKAAGAGLYQDTVEKPLSWIKSMDDISKFIPYIVPDEFDFGFTQDRCERAKESACLYGNAGLFDIVNGLGARGIGLEEMLCAIMTDDPVVTALIDKNLEGDFEYAKRGLEAGGGRIDVLYIGEDCGNQKSSLFRPELFRSFFAPRMKRFADLAHEHGAALMLHSCGSVRELMPIFIDEIGVDIHDACQPEPAGMEPAGLKRDFGKEITFCGMLSLQKTLAFGTKKDCSEEAKYLISEMGKSGGYIFSPPNTITKDTPLENILAAYNVITERELV